MFGGCYSLATVPLVDASSVQDMSYLFDGCRSLTTIPLWDVSGVINASGMFNACSSLVTVPSLDVSGVISISFLFGSTDSLASAPLSGLRVSAAVNGKLAREEIVDLFTNLGSASATITVSGNHGYTDLTGDDLAIATGKGWTVA
jgi:hypothetical protein